MSKELVCDFCSSPNIVKSIPAKSFLMMEFMGIEQWSDGAWAACPICADFISQGNWDELTERTVRTWIITAKVKLDSQQRADIRESVKKLHRKLRKAMEEYVE